MSNKKTILVTGAAGFIGYHLCETLVHLGYKVIGLDNINDYYDVNLKYARLKQLGIKQENAEEHVWLLHLWSSELVVLRFLRLLKKQ